MKKIERCTPRDFHVDKLNEVIDAVNALMPTEYPDLLNDDIPLSLKGVKSAGDALMNRKPDWVKEEIKEMMRSSDGLLKQAYTDGMRQCFGLPFLSETLIDDYYTVWLKTLPPDTLKEDRLLIAREVLFTMEFKCNYSEDVIRALERLCGMEVGG